MIPRLLTLASINESIKNAHPHSKTTFLRFSHNGGYQFDEKSEINVEEALRERSVKISEYNTCKI